VRVFLSSTFSHHCTIRASFQFGHDSQPPPAELVTVGTRPQLLDYLVDQVIQATDSISRSREEITAETPSPRMVTP
jgi:hypothetical protein